VFQLKWLPPASEAFIIHRERADKTAKLRAQKSKAKSSKSEGLYKQVLKTLELLETNPRHPGLQTHAYSSLDHPYDRSQKVFEAYIQNRTPGAYRIFWCYGPEKNEITIIAITAHP